MTIIIILYALVGLMNFGGLFAYVQEEWSGIAQEQYREDLALSLCVSFFFPFVGAFAGFFMTGFYKHGFKFY